MLLSIIVPVYNVEMYIEECLQSISNDSFDDFECIVVDDGSTDNSGLKIDQFIEIDERIKVIHKKNGGLSEARNSGIRAAQGQYIMFIDGDDYLNTGILKKVAKLISESGSPDLITCSSFLKYPAKVKKKSFGLTPLNTVVTRDYFYSKIAHSKNVHWSASDNIFKREVIELNNLGFVKNLIGAEDCDFYMNYSKFSKKFVFSNLPLFYYRQGREGSITQTMSFKAIIGQLAVFKNNFYYFHNKNTKMASFFANKFANSITYINNLESKKEILECEKIITDNKKILKYCAGSKYTFAKMIWNIFGYYNGNKVLKKIKQ
ncbi:glycosyltransferase family A protein [Aerococcus urinaeequi]|uniref:glycosyltransferase family 2 protein n=1 Tax=Aerococcus urinaeequi TaxID=51665 RepID=UPI0013FC49C2|nr:glycosyltransferase [Carnobacterium sp. PL17RED31]